jgi:hypothetical protein
MWKTSSSLLPGPTNYPIFILVCWEVAGNGFLAETASVTNGIVGAPHAQERIEAREFSSHVRREPTTSPFRPWINDPVEPQEFPPHWQPPPKPPPLPDEPPF